MFCVLIIFGEIVKLRGNVFEILILFNINGSFEDNSALIVERNTSPSSQRRENHSHVRENT